VSLLSEVCRLPTSGARAVAPFELDGSSWLAVPQLAVDVPGTVAGMNAGDSDTRLLLFRREAGCYELHSTLEAPGGEDAEFFVLDGRTFLAVASIRSGAGPYDFATPSRLFEWRNGTFDVVQEFAGYAAKQWRHLAIDGRHFLALAQGLALPGHEESTLPSTIYEWSGTGFVPFQTVSSRWGYNWHDVTVQGRRFLAHADHVEPSILYEWDGTAFVAHQVLAEQAGRAFASFTVDGISYLLVACLLGSSELLRWDGAAFVHHQTLDGAGGREWAVLTGRAGLYVVRVDFITGTPQQPETQLDSRIYRWEAGHLHLVETFPTSGGTDVAVIADRAGPLLAVSNSLTADVRFHAESVIYRFTG
jgi:hypothetical protein